MNHDRARLTARPMWLSVSRTALVTALASCVLVLPSLAASDDTEVFFARAASSENRAANVLFMFDISGSMGDYDDSPYRRITRLKQAMVDILETSDGVNVGLGAFNGTFQGGAILHPATDPDADACPNADCDSITLRVAVRQSSDDAEQMPDGAVQIDQPHLEFGETAVGVAELEIPIGDVADDAVEFASGTLDLVGPDLPFFFRPGDGAASVGLRFPNVDLPKDANILDARVEFRTVGGVGNGGVSALIGIDTTSAIGGSPPFSDADGLRVTDRPRLVERLDWDDLPFQQNDDVTIETPDLSPLLSARIARADWTTGDAIALLFEAPNGQTLDADNRRAYRAVGNGTAPVLKIRYTARGPRENLVGLRFADLDVPRGATVTSAVVELIPVKNGDRTTEIVAKAHATGDAPTFEAVAGNIGSRPLGAASVTWTPPAWTEIEREVRTVDLAPIVQEIVSRGDWCGGNALALVLEGSGLRVARAFDGSGIWDAAAMSVTYDPKSVDFTDTCTRVRTVGSVGSGQDDGTETDGAVDLAATVLDVSGAGANGTMGLRFPNVDVPAGASISSAYLRFESAGGDDESAVFEIRVEPSADAAPFSNTTANLSARTVLADPLLWTVPISEAGERVFTTDIGPLIERVVDLPGWSANEAIAVTIQRAQGTGKRTFRAFESGAGGSPRLQIGYRRESATRGGSSVTLRTTGENMLDTVLGFRARGGTPLVDSFHESALYVLGRAVDFGRTRGDGSEEERSFRVSAPSTYSGGTLFKPPDCTDVDPNAVACVGERITGAAVYHAPVAGSCQANQIVLLSDGQATANNSKDRIRGMTGAAGCAARADQSEDCGVELAEWLYAGSEADGRSPVVTHTIGFNFTSDFLRDVATAGGGRFQEASSANELAGVFRTIIDEAADIDTSFVAPAATVSQFNRLANRDDVYLAMFRPALTTRWAGNLKRYELGKRLGGDEVEFLDALGAPVLDGTSGNIRNAAKSFWTDGPADGPDVAAGGAANELALPRTLYTYTDTALSAPVLLPFHEDTPLITATALGLEVTDVDGRDALLKWARGVDVDDLDGDGDTVEVRSQMGDPMHSTPFVLNYASSDPDGKSIVFVGTNEGFLHAIDTATGAETFGFIPPELMANLGRFRADAPGLERPYGLDGAITGWFDDADGDGVVDPGEGATVVVGMRRGGRNYYALDVTDPENPTVKWVIRGGLGDFTELGQSWSKPLVTTMLDRGTPRDVLVFGGGYDPVNDTRAERNGGSGLAADGAGVTTAADGMGRALFIVDATDGSLITKIAAPAFPDMEFSIPSDLNLVDIDRDGLADMIWVGDMGGQLWRFDIGDATTLALADSISGGVVGDFGSVGLRGNRRFFYPPDVALVKDDEGKVFLNVGIGSGWRSHPLDAEVEDRFYMLRMRDYLSAPKNEDGDIEYTRLVESSLYDVTDSTVRDDTSGRSTDGWYLTFPRSGEKVLGRAVTVNSQVLFTSYVPDAGASDDCSVSVGGGRFYALDAIYGGAVQNLEEGTEATDALEPEDRSRPLEAAGLPPPVSVFISGDALDEVQTPVGLEQPAEIDPGELLKRTYWAEQ